jgi:beta-hydroxylase
MGNQSTGSTENNIFLKLVREFEKNIGRFSTVGSSAFFAPQKFGWAGKLEESWLTIRGELDTLLESVDEVPNIQDISKQQYTLTNDSKWKVYFFYIYGLKVEENCNRCSKTTQLIEQIPGITTAFFSILSSHKHLAEHKGPYKGILRCHLALKIPEPRTSCGLRVGGELRHWEEGKNLIFDDSLPHEAWNNTDEERTVLIVDFIRPMSFPFSLINRLIIKLVSFLPDVREVLNNSQNWNKKQKVQ